MYNKQYDTRSIDDQNINNNNDMACNREQVITYGTQKQCIYI